MTTPADRARRRVSGDDEPELELEGARFRAPYTRVALEWIAVCGFAGIVAAIVGVASAVVYWAWSA